MAGGRGFFARIGLDRPETRAWALYDWANSAVYTTIVGAIFPVYFVDFAARGVGEQAAGAAFAWTTTISLVLIALCAPFLGAYADVRNAKKELLALFAGLGIAAAAGMFFVGSGSFWLGLVTFGLVNVGVVGSIVFYDSLLPHVARPEEIDRVSGAGFGLGYLGGGLLLVVHALWITWPQAFGFPAAGAGGGAETLPYRVAFLSVAVWWAVFTVPLLRRVPEPRWRLESDETPSDAPLRLAIRRVAETFQELRRYRQAFTMLLAFLVYNDGIATVIRMAAIYASLKGFGREVTIGTFLVVQFVGFPAAILFGRLASRFGPKRMIVTGLGVYVGVCFFALWMSSPVHLLILGVAVGGVQGGCQALGRSLFARLVPRHKSGEFFALLAVGEKFAGILGPFLFSLALSVLPSARPAILTLIPFFVVGAWLVSKVDVEAGHAAARAAETGVRAPAE